MKNLSLKTYTKKTVLLMIGYVVLKWTLILTLGGWLFKMGWFEPHYLLALPIVGMIVFYLKRRKKDKTLSESGQHS